MRAAHATRAAALALALAGSATLAACGTSDEAEVRAVAQELKRAIDTDEGARACRLLTPRARDSKTDCAQEVLQLDPGDAATGTVAIRGERATITTRNASGTSGDGRTTLLRIDGSWRVDAYGQVNHTSATTTSTAAYERCWRAAGAQIATSAQDLAFAAADTPVVAVRKDRVSAKGGDWRIFYTLPSDGRDPGLGEVITDPQAAGVVAYIEQARAHTAVVERARACSAGG
jgi:hypothetical protein